MARPNPARSLGSEENLARRVAYERAARDLSYDALAKAMTEIGCAVQGSAIFKIEKGRPRRRISVDELVALAKVFDVGVEDLLLPVELIGQEHVRQQLERWALAKAAMIEAMVEIMTARRDLQEAADRELAEFADHLISSEGGPFATVDPRAAFAALDLPDFRVDELVQMFETLSFTGVMATAEGRSLDAAAAAEREDQGNEDD